MKIGLLAMSGIRAHDLTYESGPYAGDAHGREQIGLVPWQFNLPDPGYEEAWRALLDTARFLAPYGPTTVERHDPLFHVSARCCEWSGNSWPYATTQTLVALANLLNNYRQDVVSRQDWFRVFQTYTRTQRLAGRPYIAEAANPDDGSWDGHNSPYHSEHYFHSGYVDLVITRMIPEVAERKLARFCDVFCEAGVFSVEQSERIFRAAKGVGLEPRVHADERRPEPALDDPAR